MHSYKCNVYEEDEGDITRVNGGVNSILKPIGMAGLSIVISPFGENN